MLTFLKSLKNIFWTITIEISSRLLKITKIV